MRIRCFPVSTGSLRAEEDLICPCGLFRLKNSQAQETE